MRQTETMTIKLVNMIAMLCCGYGQGERHIRHERLAARAARYSCNAVLHSTDSRRYASNRCSTKHRNGKVLTYHLGACAAGAAVARNIVAYPLHMEHNEILRGAHVGDALDGKCRREHRSFVHTSRRTQLLCDVHVIIRSSGRCANCKCGGHVSRKSTFVHCSISVLI